MKIRRDQKETIRIIEKFLSRLSKNPYPTLEAMLSDFETDISMNDFITEDKQNEITLSFREFILEVLK